MVEYANILKLPYPGKYRLWIPGPREINITVSGTARLEIVGDTNNIIFEAVPEHKDKE